MLVDNIAFHLLMIWTPCLNLLHYYFELGARVIHQNCLLSVTSKDKLRKSKMIHKIIANIHDTQRM